MIRKGILGSQFIVLSPLPIMAAALLLFAALLTPAFLLVTLFFIIRPRPVKIPIKGRHVFITGGSTGIGLAMARRAAIEGARVSILARDASKLEAAREDIRRTTGAEVAIYSADIRDEAAVAKAVAEAGTIDLLVSNLGVGVGKEFEETTMEEIRFQVDVNIMGTMYLLKAALPGMKKASAKDGLPRSISFTTSMGGQVSPGSTAPPLSFPLSSSSQGFPVSVFSYQL